MMMTVTYVGICSGNKGNTQRNLGSKVGTELRFAHELQFQSPECELRKYDCLLQTNTKGIHTIIPTFIHQQ